jgi:hypothetical protein
LAFIEAADLASEAVAGATDSAATATGSTVRGLAATVSPSQLDPGATTQLGALPTVLLPFGDPILNIIALGVVTIVGIVLNDKGYNAVTVTLVIGVSLIALYYLGKTVFKPKTDSASSVLPSALVKNG